MTDFLDKLGSASRARVADARQRRSEAALLDAARAAPPAPALELDRFDLIAELKRRSPAAGGLTGSGFDRDRQLECYAASGAAAISVLTEPTEFNGSLADLQEAARLVGRYGCPVMRKDFLTAPYQLLEARVNGASGALVIVAMLSDTELDEMIACGLELGLFLLLEAFDQSDLERIDSIATPYVGAGSVERGPSSRTGDAADGATAAPAPGRAGHPHLSTAPPAAGAIAKHQVRLLAGLNCRNLRTLEVDFDRFEQLGRRLPADLPTVAESGIATAADIERVAQLGYRAALVGSALMRAGDPATTVSEFITAGRSRRLDRHHEGLDSGQA